MKRRLLFYLLTITTLSAATPEQVDRYLSISNADEQLVELEAQFSRMQNNLNRMRDDEETESYDMEMLSIRFKEYLQQNLSDSEMDEILDAYKNVLLLQFVSASAEAQQTDPSEIEKYLQTLQEDPDAQKRMLLVEEISDALYDKDSLAIMFDNLIKPLMQNAPGGDTIDSKAIDRMKESYVKRMQKEIRNETLFAVREFTIEELEALESLSQQSALHKESKAVFGATAYALQEFFLSLANRYDLSKHTPKPSEKTP